MRHPNWYVICRSDRFYGVKVVFWPVADDAKGGAPPLMNGRPNAKGTPHARADHDIPCR